MAEATTAPEEAVSLTMCEYTWVDEGDFLDARRVPEFVK